MEMLGLWGSHREGKAYMYVYVYVCICIVGIGVKHISILVGVFVICVCTLIHSTIIHTFKHNAHVKPSGLLILSYHISSSLRSWSDPGPPPEVSSVSVSYHIYVQRIETSSNHLQFQTEPCTLPPVPAARLNKEYSYLPRC